MALIRLFGKQVCVRLSEGETGFIYTVRYGRLNLWQRLVPVRPGVEDLIAESLNHSTRKPAAGQAERHLDG